MPKDSQVTRREFLKTGSTAAALSGITFLTRPERVFGASDRVRVALLAVCDAQARMIERRSLERDALVCQRHKEGDQILLILLGQPERMDIFVDRVEPVGLRRIEVAASIVEVHYLHERLLATIVEVRTSQLHVA